MANLGWLFYKDYFSVFNDNDYINMIQKNIGENDKKVLKDKITPKVQNIINTKPQINNNDEPLGNIHFQATTTYPGLLLGSGYLHELPDIQGQAILGFDFDYKTGLPIIRGSSIKGVLRSAFKYKEYIKELLRQDEIDIKALEEEIFGQRNSASKVLPGKDIFFDAVIVKANSLGKILGDDFLAPHGDNLLKNPIPLRFIKILPDVTFRFDFYLSDGIITKEEKVFLFGAILYDLGVGAKTNVGYGRFDNSLTKENLTKQIQKQKDIQRRQELSKKIANSDSNSDKGIAIIEKSQKASNDLLKKLKELNLSQNDKEKISEAFENKYQNDNGKFAKKIRNLLK